MEKPRCESCVHAKPGETLTDGREAFTCEREPPRHYGFAITSPDGREWVGMQGQPTVVGDQGCAHHPKFPNYLAWFECGRFIENMRSKKAEAIRCGRS